MNNKLAVRNFDDVVSISTAMAKSGFFSDAKQAAQAIVKVMAGNELGLGPFASMTGINVIKGKPALSANLIATLIKNDPRYDYKVITLTDEECELAFYENDQEVGRSPFTMKDLDQAEGGSMVVPGTKKPMKNRFPRNLLFARAMTNGAKWFAAGVFGGVPVYTAEELGADTDDDGYIVDIPTITTPDLEYDEPEPEQKPTGRTLEAGSIEAIVKLGLAENDFAATNAIKKSNFTGKVSIDEAVSWMTSYRGARDEGMTSDDAAELANIHNAKDTQAEVLNELGY